MITSFDTYMKLYPNTNRAVEPMGLAHVVEALVLRFTSFKVQGLTSHGCKQFLGTTPLGEKPAIQPVPCKETSEGAVHRTKVYSDGVSPKGPTLEKFSNIKKQIELWIN
jgi:hypothetical protein